MNRKGMLSVATTAFGLALLVTTSGCFHSYTVRTEEIQRAAPLLRDGKPTVVTAQDWRGRTVAVSLRHNDAAVGGGEHIPIIDTAAIGRLTSSEVKVWHFNPGAATLFAGSANLLVGMFFAYGFTKDPRSAIPVIGPILLASDPEWETCESEGCLVKGLVVLTTVFQVVGAAAIATGALFWRPEEVEVVEKAPELTVTSLVFPDGQVGAGIVGRF